MGLPPANIVLFFLSGFVGLWGVSALARGLWAGRDPASRRCPECGVDMHGIEGRRCPACEFEAASERGLLAVRRDVGAIVVGVVGALAGAALVPVAGWVRQWETTGEGEGWGMHPLGAVFWGVACFGVALAVWGWRGDRSKGRRRCSKCWYDMSGTLTRGAGAARPDACICPECGHDAKSERGLYRPRRRRKVAAIGLALVVAGIFGQAVPRVMRVGPIGFVPTTVLIAGMEWLPELWIARGGLNGEGSLGDRLRNDTWGWQERWAAARASRLLRHGPLDRLHAVVLLGPFEPEDRVALLQRVLSGVLSREFDWAATPGREIASLCAAAMWNRREVERLGDWNTFQAAVHDAADALVGRLDPSAPDETGVVLALLGAASIRPAGIEDRAIELMDSQDRRVQTAAVIYLSDLDEDSEMLERAVMLLDDESPQKRWAAQALVMRLSERTDQQARARSLLETVAASDPDCELGASALVFVLRYSEDPNSLLREWIGAGAFSPGVRCALLNQYGWTGDSQLLLDWIRPAVQDATPAELAGVIECLAHFPLASASARDGFVGILTELSRHPDGVVAGMARDLLRAVQSEEPGEDRW